MTHIEGTDRRQVEARIHADPNLMTITRCATGFAPTAFGSRRLFLGQRFSTAWVVTLQMTDSVGKGARGSSQNSSSLATRLCPPYRLAVTSRLCRRRRPPNFR